MTFEEALRAELITIADLDNKVYPLVAPKGEQVPFLVYKKGNIKFTKAFDGIQKKYDSTYTIIIISNTYAELQAIESSVVDLFIGFLGRPLSTSDIVIRDLDVEILGNQYEAEVDFCRSDIQLKVKY